MKDLRNAAGAGFEISICNDSPLLGFVRSTSSGDSGSRRKAIREVFVQPKPSFSAPQTLHLKQIGEYWSVRITNAYRALALRQGDEFTWVWIGSHDDYERIIR
jgi:hypothetical protein